MVLMFAGKAGAGKDTSATVVQSFIPQTERFAFAYKVKEIAKQFGWDGVKDEKGRKLLQSVGQTGRAYDKDLWAKDCAQRIAAYSGLALVTDLRFRNEMNVVKEAFPDAKVILVKGRAADLGENAKDISEHDLDGFDDFDFVLDNSGTEEDLKNNVEAMLKEFDLI